MAMDVLSTQVKASERRESGLKDFRLLGKLWPYMRAHKRSLSIAFVLLPVIALAEMGQTLLIRSAIDGPIRAGQWHGLLMYSAGYAALLFLNYRVRYAQMAESQRTGQLIVRDLRTDLYRHLQSLSPRFYQTHPLGKLVTRLTSDIENLSEMLSSGGLAMLADLAMIVGAVIGMFVLNWRLAWVAIVTMALLIAAMEFFRNRARHAYDEIRVKMARINAFLQENFSGMELVQLYGRQEKNERHFRELNASNMQSGLNSIFYSTTFNALVEFTTILTLVLILWLGSFGVQQGTMTIGALVGFFLFVRKMFEPVEDISEKYTILQSGLASIDKVMALFKERPDIVSTPNETESYRKIRSQGDIRFERVSFGYHADHPVLKEIDLHIRSGEKIAIVGPSGAGKTTLIKLLLRFYDVNEGAIRLDRRDIREWPLTALRGNIVSIQQDDFLFSRSLADNILLDSYMRGENPEVDARLEEALVASNARQFVERLPQGVETMLEERGKNLSAGEKQLLLFARAIFHDPAVLILDEATSAIDPMTERWVRDAMEKLMRNRTVIIVAHRLSTVRQADRILVMEHGRIVQQGRHETLISQPGLYQEFCRYQDLVAR